MKIVVNLTRQRKGNRRSKLVITDQYLCDAKDDMELRNCGVEIYSAWRETIDAIDAAKEIVRVHRGGRFEVNERSGQ